MLAVEALEREVNNGGYGQYFINSSNEYVPIIVEALNRTGCSDAAKLTREAIDSLGIEGSIDADAIELAMEEEDEARDTRLNKCDDSYYEIVGDLAGPLFDYIRKVRDKINLKE